MHDSLIGLNCFTKWAKIVTIEKLVHPSADKDAEAKFKFNPTLRVTF